MGNHISILLAVHNGEKYIEESILSILNQTSKNFELLICANGCTDDTVIEIAKIMKTRFMAEKIRLFTLPEANKSKALNYLLLHATGHYIAIQDADDLWHPQKLELQSKYLGQYTVIGTWPQYIDSKGEKIEWSRTFPESDTEIRHMIRVENKNPIINSSALVRTRLAKSVEGFDPEYEGVEDFHFWARICCNTTARFVNVNKALTMHRIHENSSFNTKNQKEKIEEIVAYINEYSKQYA